MYPEKNTCILKMIELNATRCLKMLSRSTHLETFYAFLVQCKGIKFLIGFYYKVLALYFAELYRCRHSHVCKSTALGFKWSYICFVCLSNMNTNITYFHLFGRHKWTLNTTHNMIKVVWHHKWTLIPHITYFRLFDVINEHWIPGITYFRSFDVIHEHWIPRIT